METNEMDYDVIFKDAKQSTVLTHAMVWIKYVLDHKQTNREQFEEIKKIVDEATKHLKS